MLTGIFGIFLHIEKKKKMFNVRWKTFTKLQLAKTSKNAL